MNTLLKSLGLTCLVCFGILALVEFSKLVYVAAISHPTLSLCIGVFAFVFLFMYLAVSSVEKINRL